MMNNLIMAYLDLGAGSMLLQMLLAGLLGLSLTIKNSWRRILRLMRGGKRGTTSLQPPPPPADRNS